MMNYSKKERRGLPGGPNEQFSYVTGFFTQSNPFRSMIQYQDGAEVIPPYNYIDRDFGKRFGKDSSVLGYSNNTGVFLGENLPEAQIVGSSSNSLLGQMRSDYEKLHPLPEGVKWGVNGLEGDPKLTEKWLNNRNAYIYERMRYIPQQDLSTTVIDKNAVEDYMNKAYEREIEMLSSPEGLYRLALSIKDDYPMYRFMNYKIRERPPVNDRQEIVTFDDAAEESYYMGLAKGRLNRLKRTGLKTKSADHITMLGALGYYHPTFNNIVLRDDHPSADIFAHEMNHNIGKLREKWQDRYLRDNIEFKDLNSSDTKYMLSSSDELTAFLRGTRAQLQQDGYIDHPYEYITAEQLKEAYDKYGDKVEFEPFISSKPKITETDLKELNLAINSLKSAIRVRESDKANSTRQDVRDAIDKSIQKLSVQLKEYEDYLNDEEKFKEYLKNKGGYNNFYKPYRFLKSMKPTEENFKHLEKVINSLADNSGSNTYDDFAKFGKELKPKRKLKKKAQRGQEVYDYEKNLDFETMSQYANEVGMPYAWRQFNDAEKALYRKVMRQFNFKDQPVNVYDPRGVNAEYYQDPNGQTYMQSAPAASIKDIPLAAGKYIKEFDDRNPKPKGNLREDWENKRNAYVVQGILKDHPELTERDVEYINSLTPTEQRFLSTDRRFQQSYYQDMTDALGVLGGAYSNYGQNIPIPGVSSFPSYSEGDPINRPKRIDEVRIPQIQNDPNKTDYEKQQLINMYEQAPGAAAFGEVLAGTEAPVQMLYGLGKAAYDPNLTMDQVLEGKKDYDLTAGEELAMDAGYEAAMFLGTGGLGTLAKGIGKGAKKLAKRKLGELKNIDYGDIEKLYRERKIASLADDYLEAGSNLKKFTQEKRKELTTPEGQRRLKNMYKEYLQNAHNDWTEAEIEEASDMLTSRAILSLDTYRNESEDLGILLKHKKTFDDYDELVDIDFNSEYPSNTEREAYNNYIGAYYRPGHSLQTRDFLKTTYPDNLQAKYDNLKNDLRKYDDYRLRQKTDPNLPSVWKDIGFRNKEQQLVDLEKTLKKYQSNPGGLFLGPPMDPKPTTAHEVQHSLQFGNTMPVDTRLKNLVYKNNDNLSEDLRSIKSYFHTGSGGQESSAFLSELREQALQDGLIKERYEKITPEKVKEWYKYYEKNPKGYNIKKEDKSKKATHHRIFDIIEPVDENFELLSKELNELAYNDNFQNDPTTQYAKRGGERRLQRRGMSRDGYKRYSPDVNNPYNIIPSGNITMKDVDFPVMGIDNFGNKQMMYPGYDYVYPGNTVLEIPMFKKR